MTPSHSPAGGTPFILGDRTDNGNVGVVLREVHLPFLFSSSTSEIPWKVFLLKAGVNLKAVFTPLKTGSTKISRSRFKQSRNSLLIP